MEMNQKPSKCSGLRAAMAVELMIGFWFGIGAILDIKMVNSLEDSYKQKIRLLSIKWQKKINKCNKNYNKCNK